MGKALPKEKDKKIKKKSISKLKKELDKVFSEYIRRRDKGVCCACGKKDHWKYMQAGHYISRSALATRYDPTNVHCECVGCNIFKNGNMPSYTLFLIRKYGSQHIERLYKASKTIIKNYPYQATIDYYSSLNVKSTLT